MAHSRTDLSNLTPLSHRFWSFLVWRYPLWRNLEIQNFFALGPLGGVLWAFQILAFLAHLQFLNDHILASTNDRRLVLVSNIKFWNELSEKIYEIFFWAQKSHFFAKRGPFWVPVTPSARKFEILTLPYHFHIKFMLESTKKNMVSNLYEGAIDFQSFYCNMQMRFLAKTAKKQLWKSIASPIGKMLFFFCRF